MRMAVVILEFRNGTGAKHGWALSDRDLRDLEFWHREGAVRLLLERALRENVARGWGREGESIADLAAWRVEYERRDGSTIRRGAMVGDTPERLAAGKSDTRTHQRVERCRSVLRVANLLLPRGVREDAFDEWVDEIECAAEAGLAVVSRTLSILFRSLPVMVWRSRGLAQVQRGRG